MNPSKELIMIFYFIFASDFYGCVRYNKFCILSILFVHKDYSLF